MNRKILYYNLVEFIGWFIFVASVVFSIRYASNWYTDKYKCKEGTTLHIYSTWDWMTRDLECVFPRYSIWCKDNMVDEFVCSSMRNK